jgi:hypothetical protein
MRGWIGIVALAGASLHAQVAPRADSAPALDETRLFTNLSALAADSMEGRLAGSPGGDRARRFLTREFARIGLTPLVKGYAIPFSRRSMFPGPVPSTPPRPQTSRSSTTPARTYPLVFGNNLVGIVRGSLHPNRYIVVSAHYDHLGVRNGEIYHGADDNASGSAAILSIAEWTIAHPPLNSVIFAWFDAEEEGLLGSTVFVDRPPVPLDSIIADVNLDMVSRSATGELDVVGATAWPVMQPFIDTIAALGLVSVRQGHAGTPGDPNESDLTNRSDQGPFNRQRIPFVMFTNGEHADYHRPTDEATRITPEFYYHSAQTAAALLHILDGSLDRVALVRAGRK